ncbi:MAG: topoisomerase [Polyangiaceae bacterium]|jgi:DNA topoisomerase-1|nr:topoisomerase [Polyangiaceae bacterium]
MPKTLVVVESPAKAKTIQKYLGKGYEVLASKGHVKDLPKKMGIDVANDFRETYEIIEAKSKVLLDLKHEVKDADTLLLATDPDREGEAIAWHLMEELQRPDLSVRRVEFEEITKKGVQRGLDNPRDLDQNLYDAQRCRRVLDRIVGYDVSALVWSKLAFGLSAGRVQSVALRLIVEREREIEAFIPEEYWNVGVALKGKAKTSFHARLTKADGEKLEVKDGTLAAQVKEELQNATYKVANVTQREQKRNALAPYTTSKIQQDATSYLRFTTKRTMSIAQKLYEGIDLKKDGGLVGLITYMRTDSVRVSPDAVIEARAYIEATHGKQFLPAQPNVFKSRKDAQEAHEAIRPTSLEYTPAKVRKYLTDEQYKLYKLVWDRFLASQMAPAVYDQTGVDIEASCKAGSAHKVLGLRASGKVLKFAGWLEQYQSTKDEPVADGEEAAEGGAPKELAGEEDAKEANGDGASAANAAAEDEEGLLPELTMGESLALHTPPGVLAEQKFTQPPARFNEGSLVRELEKRGIGRPSTYAEIISKVQARDYVERLPGGQMKASDLGKTVVDGLVSTQLDFMEPSFTAKMEEDLDDVQAGKLARSKLLERFYGRFREVLDVAKKKERWAPEPEPTEFPCPETGDQGHKLLKRWSKNGFFLGCEDYPKCKYTRDFGADGTLQPVKLTDYDCEKCGKKMIIKSGRYGEFLSCSDYPTCKTTRPVPLGVPCPKCGGDIVEVRSKKRGAKSFYGCTRYNATPSCDFKLWQKPVAIPCPVCACPFMTIGGGAKNPKLICGRGKDCGHSQPLEEGMLEAVGKGAEAGAEPDDAPDSDAAPKRGGKSTAAAVAP